VIHALKHSVQLEDASMLLTERISWMFYWINIPLAASLLVIMLVIGFAPGLFSGGLYRFRKGDRKPPVPPQFTIGNTLERDLQLTDTQMDQLSQIFKEYEKKAERIREEIREQVALDLDSLRLQLIPYLTVKQVQLLDRWIEGRPPPGPGPTPGVPEPGQYPPDKGQMPPTPWPAPPPGQGLPPGVSPHPPGQQVTRGIRTQFP
jgi:hypothetical protein